MALGAAVLLASALMAPVAAAQVLGSQVLGSQSLGSLRAEASQLEARIQTLGLQEAALSERYDGARYALSLTESRLARARGDLRAALSAEGRARGVLRTEAVDAYVSGSGGSGGLQALSSANESLLRAEYEETLASSQSDAMDSYEAASLAAATAGRLMLEQERLQAAGLRSIAADRSKVQASADQLDQLLASDKGRIGAMLAAEAAAQRAAAERAAQARLRQLHAAAVAAAAAAATRATDAPVVTTSGSSGGSAPGGGTGSSGPGAGFTPPPSSSAAAVAVAAAESRVGDPYVWGAAGPSSFDCSGLVMWAYEQAGIQLPHFSGAQYADTVHIPMSDLQPGDLVFFSNPDIHVAMYVGNGMIVQAPYTGAYVEIVPMFSGFTLASRVE